MIAALARIPATRLTRTPRAWLGAVAWVAIGVAMAVTTRMGGAPNGADHVLVGALGALVLPLLAFAVVGGVLGGTSLRNAVAPAVSFGASPASTALVTVTLALVVTTVLSASLSGVVAVVAHGIDDPPLSRDVVASMYAGALGGAAYAALFSMGASMGRRGGGRALLLVVDWVLGSNRTVLALVTPRAHLRNLLGGAPPYALAERTSAVLLVVLALLFVLVAVRRTRTA